MKENAFNKLRDLIAAVPAPKDKQHYLLHLGESKLLGECSMMFRSDLSSGWDVYPEPGGGEDLLHAYRIYLESQYSLSEQKLISSGIAIEPTPGSKYAISTLIQISAQKYRQKNFCVPVILLPDPCYPSYVDAALYAQCQVIFYPVSTRGEIQPLLTLMSRHQRQLCAVIICNPGNPYGNCLNWEDMQKICCQGKVLIVFDECYADLYYHEPIDSLLGEIASGNVSGENIVVCHTLSKRSCMPGLRSGFLCGSQTWVEDWASYNRACGVSLSRPICKASTQLWKDERLIKEHRTLIANNISLFYKYFTELNRPQAGFFVCIPVTNDLLITQKLWHEEGILVMPSSYLMNIQKSGIGFLRIALVYPEKIMNDILIRLKYFFDKHKILFFTKEG